MYVLAVLGCKHSIPNYSKSKLATTNQKQGEILFFVGRAEPNRSVPRTPAQLDDRAATELSSERLHIFA